MSLPWYIIISYISELVWLLKERFMKGNPGLSFRTRPHQHHGLYIKTTASLIHAKNFCFLLHRNPIKWETAVSSGYPRAAARAIQELTSAVKVRRLKQRVGPNSKAQILRRIRTGRWSFVYCEEKPAGQVMPGWNLYTHVSCFSETRPLWLHTINQHCWVCVWHNNISWQSVIYLSIICIPAIKPALTLNQQVLHNQMGKVGSSGWLAWLLKHRTAKSITIISIFILAYLRSLFGRIV